MPLAEGKEAENNKDIVYGVLEQMTRPILTTNNNLRQIIKFHRKLDLSESQMRTILDKLREELKIATSQDGNTTKISILTDYEEMVFSQPYPAHKIHNTPHKAFEVQKYLMLYCVGYKNRISMQELAKRFQSGGQTQLSAEREIRDIVEKTNNDRYISEENHPFDRVIMSNSSAYGAGGYWLVKDQEEAHDAAMKSRVEAMTYWKRHWHRIRKLEKQDQLRFRSSPSEKAIFKAISDDLTVNPIAFEEEDD